MTVSDTASGQPFRLGPHPFVAELVAAIRELNGPDLLSADRLGSLLTAANQSPAGWALDSFRAELEHAWDMAREPTPEDLADADWWEAGLIDWLDPADIDTDELIGVAGTDADAVAVDDYRRRMVQLRDERARLLALGDVDDPEVAA